MHDSYWWIRRPYKPMRMRKDGRDKGKEHLRADPKPELKVVNPQALHEIRTAFESEEYIPWEKCLDICRYAVKEGLGPIEF